MSLFLVQYRCAEGRRRVALVGEDGSARRLHGTASVLALAQAAIRDGRSPAAAAAAAVTAEEVDLETVELLPPIDHPDPAHLLLSGTGLTHLGSAESRDEMHRAAAD